MNILGIGDHVSCGAAILRDGVFSSVVIDERLVREKMVFGVSRQGIAKNLELSGLRPADIDRVAIATVNQHLIDHYVDFRDGWFGLQRGPVGDALSRRSVPNVLSVHGGDLYDPSKWTSRHRHPALRRWVRALLERANAVIAQSSDTLGNARRFYSPQLQAEVIPLGIKRPPTVAAPRQG